MQNIQRSDNKIYRPTFSQWQKLVSETDFCPYCAHSSLELINFNTSRLHLKGGARMAFEGLTEDDYLKALNDLPENTEETAIPEQPKEDATVVEGEGGFIKGEWQIRDRGFSKLNISVNPNDAALCEDICSLYGSSTDTETLANAKRIVECVNGWDKLQNDLNVCLNVCANYDKENKELKEKVSALQLENERLKNENANMNNALFSVYPLIKSDKWDTAPNTFKNRAFDKVDSALTEATIK